MSEPWSVDCAHCAMEAALIIASIEARRRR
jgi:hypothetical protein